ncbi:hypothetical protein [Nocardia xishanensis]|uniref:hypothetical protein n=1 Tax=Nocardia xishanensis TaxID=238964 RepID=UPI0008341984|nr:hypothetical protein [Nocardia xishanensis]
MSDTIDNWMVPGREQLVAACRGLPHDDHPMLEAAGELAQLHVLRERTPGYEMAKLDRRRVQLIRSIDRWMTLATPVPGGGRPNSETVGGMVDRLAQLIAQACVPLAAAPDSVFHDVWSQVVDLAERYQDLVDALQAGTREVPDGVQHPL